MTSARTASEFAVAARRFTRAITETSSEWNDELGRRIRDERCRPIEQEVARLVESLEQLAREADAARRVLR